MGVDIEELCEQGLYAFEVDVGVRVEPFEFDVERIEILENISVKPSIMMY